MRGILKNQIVLSARLKTEFIHQLIFIQKHACICTPHYVVGQILQFAAQTLVSTELKMNSCYVFWDNRSLSLRDQSIKIL